MIFENSFHNTIAMVARPVPVGPGIFRLSRAQVTRVRRALCGVSGCLCAQNALGTRGQGINVIENLDGSVEVEFGGEAAE